MSDALSQLQDLDDQWQDTGAAAGGFASVPDGVYHFTLKDANVNNSQTSGRLQVTYKWDVIDVIKAKDADPEKEIGKILTSNQGLDSETGIGFMKRDIGRFECEIPGKMSELPSVLDDMINRTVEVNVKNKEGFCNIYVNGIAGAKRRGSSSRSSSPGGRSRASDESSRGEF